MFSYKPNCRVSTHQQTFEVLMGIIHLSTLLSLLNNRPSCVWTAGSLDIWAITVEERAKHDQQFQSLKPISGFITGMYVVTVRTFLLSHRKSLVHVEMGAPDHRGI